MSSPCRPLSSCRRQRGQALVEVTLSALLALIPAFIFGWALYAHGQARTTALNGARYAAWELTVWRDPGSKSWSGAAARSTGEIENLMIERFFARPEAPISRPPPPTRERPTRICRRSIRCTTATR